MRLRHCEINNYAFFDGIREKCAKAGSLLDTDAYATAKPLPYLSFWRKMRLN